MIGRPRRWSVRTRLGAVSTLAATVGLAVAGLTAYIVTSQVLHEQIDESLSEAPSAVGRDSLRPPSGGDEVDRCEAITSSRGPSPGLFVVQLVQADGSVCADPESTQVELIDADLDTSERGVRLRDGTLSNGHPARIAVVVGEDDEILITARDTAAVENVLDVLQWTLAGVTLLGALIALAMTRFTTRAALRPITQFTRVAERIAETGKLDEHLATRDPGIAGQRGDELDRLAHAFDTMTAVLADAQLRQRRLVADAGHELRTPLTSLRANVALLHRSRQLGRPLPGDDEERLMADLTTQVNELSHLIDDLAELAFSDVTPPPFQSVAFDECVENAVDRARSRTSDHELLIELDPWLVSGNAPALERAVVNLLDNAIKFSPPGTPVEVILRGGTLTVADRGPGIDPADRELVLERFWRSDSARRLPGSGLGLAIVREVVAHHGGTLTIDARGGGGTVARLTLPGSADR